MREVLFSDFVKLCKRLRQASSVLEKRNLIASFLTRIDRSAGIISHKEIQVS